MKTNIFSFKRLGLLFQRYFAERLHIELIYWGIMVIVFMFIRNSISLMTGLIIIGGVFYAARFFREIHLPNSGVAYFMIPATHLEKLTVGIVMTSFYYFAMMIITYIIGNLAGSFIYNMIAGIDFIKNTNMLSFFFHSSPLQWKLFGISNVFEIPIENGLVESVYGNFLLFLFKFFLIEQSIYLLGSIYFKRYQFFATLLATSIIQSIISTFSVIIIIIFFGSFFINLNFDFNYNDLGKIISNIFRIIWLIPPYFWLVSYFRLTEKQV